MWKTPAITFRWILQCVFGKLDGCACTFITAALQYLHVQGALKERNNYFLFAISYDDTYAVIEGNGLPPGCNYVVIDSDPARFLLSNAKHE